mgnify:CR=1 FL=1
MKGRGWTAEEPEWVQAEKAAKRGEFEKKILLKGVKKEYKPGALVLGNKQQKTAEQGLYDRGERPDALIAWPVDAPDYELVDIFNWQEEAAGMIFQMEFVRRVDVQAETIERYVRDGLLVPDLVVPMSEHRTFKYFKEEALQKYAEQYSWTLTDDSNRIWIWCGKWT